MINTVDESMRGVVLTIGLDDLTLERIKTLVRDTELEVEAVGREDIIERAQTVTCPVVVLLEWSEELVEAQKKTCAALRHLIRPRWCHILAVGGMADPALARALDGAANDVLTRPFGAEVVPRLRHALRWMRAEPAAETPRDALDKALQSASSGEVAVRSGEAVGHIHVLNGLVVWANLSTVPSTMEEVASHAGIELDADIVAAVREECRTRRVHFMDVLVAWSIIDADRARDAVRTFVAGRVQRILELPDAVALFLPKARQHGDLPRFGLDGPPVTRREVRSLTPLPTSGPATLRNIPFTEVVAAFDAAKEIEGACSVAVLDRRTGGTLLLHGDEIDAAVAWSQINVLAALGHDAGDVIASAGDRCYVSRPLQAAPALALVVVLSQVATTLGLARAIVAQICSGRVPRVGAR